MGRRRWHDIVIYLSILALAAIGVFAIWGDTITGWFDSGETPAQVEPVAPPDDPV